MTRRRLRHTGGFTLLEILVALSLMAIVLVAVFRLSAQSVTMATAAGFHGTAPFLAEKKISELTDAAELETGSSSGDFGDDFPGYSFEAEVTENPVEALGGKESRLMRVDVAVSFNQGEFTYRLRTYRLAGPAK